MASAALPAQQPTPTPAAPPPPPRARVWLARAGLAALALAPRRDGAAASLRSLSPAGRGDAAARVLDLATAVAALDNATAPAATLLEFAVELDDWRTRTSDAAAAALASLVVGTGHEVYLLRWLATQASLIQSRSPPDAASAPRLAALKGFREKLLERLGRNAAGFLVDVIREPRALASLSLGSPQKGTIKRGDANAAIRDLDADNESRLSLLPLSGAETPAAAAAYLDEALDLDDADTFARVGSQNLKIHYAREEAWPAKLARVEEMALARRWSVVSLQEVHWVKNSIERHVSPTAAAAAAAAAGAGGGGGELAARGCPVLGGLAPGSTWVHAHAGTCDGTGATGCGLKAEGVSFFYDTLAWERLGEGVARYDNAAGCVAVPAPAAPREGAADRFAREPAAIFLRSTGALGPPGVLALVAVHLRSEPPRETEAEARALRRVAEWAARKAAALAQGARVATLFIGDFNLPPKSDIFVDGAGFRGPPAVNDSVFTNLAHVLGGEGASYDNAWLAAASNSPEWLGDPAGSVVMDRDLAAFVPARREVLDAANRALARAVALRSGAVAERMAAVIDLVDSYAERVKTTHSDHLAIEAVLRLRSGGGAEAEAPPEPRAEPTSAGGAAPAESVDAAPPGPATPSPAAAAVDVDSVGNVLGALAL